MSRGLQAEETAPERANPDPERPESALAPSSPSIEDQRLATGGYRVSLPMFEGPLDLLLHLVQKHELDILNIPIAFITERYVEYIQLLDELNIDLASEYLVMAATLVHIKSRMLLPNAPEDEASDGAEEEELDPRAELVRRLLEYQKYKLAAEQLGERAILGRDVFPRGSSDELAGGEAPLEALASFKLLDAFQAVLERTQKTREHQIDFERFSLSEKIGELSELLRRRRRLVFHEMFHERASRAELIITFLALLEMTRLRLTRLRQDGPLEPIYIELAVTDEELPPEEELPADAASPTGDAWVGPAETPASDAARATEDAVAAAPLAPDVVAAADESASDGASASEEALATEGLSAADEPLATEGASAPEEPLAPEAASAPEEPLATEAASAPEEALPAGAADEPLPAGAALPAQGALAADVLPPDDDATRAGEVQLAGRFVAEEPTSTDEGLAAEESAPTDQDVHPGEGLFAGETALEEIERGAAEIDATETAAAITETAAGEASVTDELLPGDTVFEAAPESCSSIDDAPEVKEAATATGEPVAAELVEPASAVEPGVSEGASDEVVSALVPDPALAVDLGSAERRAAQAWTPAAEAERATAASGRAEHTVADEPIGSSAPAAATADAPPEELAPAAGETEPRLAADPREYE